MLYVEEEVVVIRNGLTPKEETYICMHTTNQHLICILIHCRKLQMHKNKNLIYYVYIFVYT